MEYEEFKRVMIGDRKFAEVSLSLELSLGLLYAAVGKTATEADVDKYRNVFWIGVEEGRLAERQQRMEIMAARIEAITTRA